MHKAGLVTIQQNIYLPQAEARQKQFEKTPGGKAAIKSVREAKRPAPNQQIRQDESNARDWLS
jgi:hypothetical protein